MTTRFRVERFARGDDTGVQSNIAGHIQHKLGDVEAGFRQAEVIVEREFTTQSVHHGYIEPHVTTVSWSPDDHVTIWTSTQGAFAIRSSTAAILGLPESQVKVIPMEIGGGFGGKAVTYLDPVAAVIAELAEQLGMDPMEFRLKNAVQAGDPMPNGTPHAPFGCRELEEAMLAHPHYDAPLAGPNQGRGMAVGFRWQGGQSSSATLHVNSNGTINLITGSV